MTSHIYREEIKSMIRQGFNTDKDLLDEASTLKPPPGAASATDLKLQTVAKSTFRGIQELIDYRLTANENVSEIRQAAQLIERMQAGQQINLEDPGVPETVKRLVETATRKFGHRLEAVSKKLCEYANDLEKAYKNIEADLSREILIKGRHASETDALQSISDSYQTTRNYRGQLREIGDNFRRGRIEIYDDKGVKIPFRDIPKKAEGRPTGEDALICLRESILPEIFRRSGMVAKGEGEFTPAAQSILDDFAADIQVLERFDPHEEGNTEIATSLFLNRLDNYCKSPDPAVRNVGFLLRTMGSFIPNTCEKSLKNTIGIANKQDGQVEFSPEARLRTIELHLNPQKAPFVIYQDIRKLADYSEGTQIKQQTSLTPSPDNAESVTINTSIELSSRTKRPENSDILNVLKLAGFQCWLTTGREILMGDTSLVPYRAAEASQSMPYSSMEHTAEEIQRSSCIFLRRVLQMCRQLDVPPEIQAQLMFKKAMIAEGLIGLAGGDLKTGGAFGLLADAYGVSDVRFLPPKVRDVIRTLMTDEYFPDQLPEATKKFMPNVERLARSEDTAEAKEAYTALMNDFSSFMTIQPDEWMAAYHALTPPIKTLVEQQLEFLGLHRLNAQDLNRVLNAALITGVIKGTNPQDMDIIRGFIEVHGTRAIGVSSMEGVEEVTELSPLERKRIDEMREKEMLFADLCLNYDQRVGQFTQHFREKTLELMNLIIDYRKEVESQISGEEHHPTTLEGIAEEEIAKLEPFDPNTGDYYQGSIPVHRVADALRDPNTNFRTTMWLCANLDHFWEDFFIHQYADGTSRLDRFEEFIRNRNSQPGAKRVEWMDFDKMRAQFAVSGYVTESMGHRKELDDQAGRSLFHPRHPFTTNVREAGGFKERVQRKLVLQTERMVQEESVEEFLRAHDMGQQNIMPLSIFEIERHNPELYARLAANYDLETPEGREAALQGPEIAEHPVIRTKWASGGKVWAMNEGVLVDKQDASKQYRASPLTKLLTRAVPMTGGISGHVEFVLHLASYFGMDKRDALIATFANLVMCNAHTVAEVVLGCSGFLDVLPRMGDIEFNENMFPKLTEWVMANVPAEHPARQELLGIAKDLSELD